MLTERELREIVTGVLAGLGYQIDGDTGGTATAAAAPTAPWAAVAHPAVGAGAACPAVPSCNPAPQPGLAYRAPHSGWVAAEEPPARDGGTWRDPEAMREMVAATPARISIGRAGARYDTEAWLKFRMDHAAARDAIFHEIPDDFAARHGAVPVRTRVADRRQYLIRPDLGRRLDPASEAVLRQRCTPGAQVQVLLVDGLSGIALERNAPDFLRTFQDGLQRTGLTLGVPIYVQFGRVAVMDHIGDLLRPELVVELVGERPGLVTAESMSAYFCYRPGLGTIESDRTLISNIHKGGIPPVEAGAHAANLAARILQAGVSGVKLTLQAGR